VEGAGAPGGARRGGRRPGRLLLCAAAVVPAMLVAAGCSSGSSGSDGADAKGSSGASATPSQSASASASASGDTVRQAAYTKLPEPCDVLSKDTLKDLVPKGVKSGKEGDSSDTATRSSCSWSSLDNNGVKGSQFRWLNVSLLRFESSATQGEGDDLAHEYYTRQVGDAESAEDAKNSKTETVSGTGDEASLVRYDLKKKEGSFKQQTVVSRVENVVVTLDYNGAGLAGEKTPDADDLVKLAKKAAKEAVASVTATNEGGSTGSGTTPSASASKSASPSKSSKSTASASASAKASASASKASATKTASASESASSVTKES
jgi:hypothetical protein